MLILLSWLQLDPHFRIAVQQSQFAIFVADFNGFSIHSRIVDNYSALTVGESIRDLPRRIFFHSGSSNTRAMK